MKEIQNYNGRYLIDEHGNIYSNFSNKYLSKVIDKYGYERICLSMNAKAKTYQVHRLVALAYCKRGREDQTQVNHKDGVKTNNHYSNLEWCNNSENVQHAFDTGLKTVSKEHRAVLAKLAKKKFTGRRDTKGILNANHKLTEIDVFAIRERIANKESLSSIGRSYSVTPSCIWDIKTGKRWSDI